MPVNHLHYLGSSPGSWASNCSFLLMQALEGTGDASSGWSLPLLGDLEGLSSPRSIWGMILPSCSSLSLYMLLCIWKILIFSSPKLNDCQLSIGALVPFQLFCIQSGFLLICMGKQQWQPIAWFFSILMGDVEGIPGSWLYCGSGLAQTQLLQSFVEWISG